MPENKEVRAGHRQRLKDKFQSYGLDKFTDEEIIELLLTFGTPRRDCKQPARELLKTYGTIREVFEADPRDLAAIPGVGPNNIVAIKFIHAVAGKYLEKRLIDRVYLSSSKKVMEYLQHHMQSLTKEVFKIIYLDAANGVLALEDGSRGTVSSAAVYPREVIERALSLKAASLVFAHNHPSGKVQPSPDDYRLTRQLIQAAFVVQLRVVDHLIIGAGNTYYSFRDQGHLARYETEIKQFYFSMG